MGRDDQTDAGRKGASPQTKAGKSTQIVPKRLIFTDSDDRNPPSLPGPQQ